MKFFNPLRIIRNLLPFFSVPTTVVVVVYRSVPTYATPLMVIRSVQQVFKGESSAWYHEWVSFDRISPHLPMAAIASEGNHFATYNGFDFIEIQKAVKENEKCKRKRGASTIDQQMAKSVFPRPQPSWLRRGFEVYLTWMIELFQSKERIMTAYLNSIEMGKGIYRAQTTARYKFHTTAAKFSIGRCVLVAVALPNPMHFDSAHPSNCILKRQGQTLRLMKFVAKFPPEKVAVFERKKK